MESQEEWELTDREGGLRELRGVLSTPHRRSSRKSSISGLILGGTTGVLVLFGVGGYYGLSVLFPSPISNPVVVNPDLLADADTPAVVVPAAVGEGGGPPQPIEIAENTGDVAPMENTGVVEPVENPGVVEPVMASIELEPEGVELRPSPAPGEVAATGGVESAAPVMEPIDLASIQQDAPVSPVNPAPAAAPVDAARMSPEMSASLKSVADAPAAAPQPQGPASASLPAPLGALSPSPAPAIPPHSSAPPLEIASLAPAAVAPGRAPSMSALPSMPAPTALGPHLQAVGETGGAPQIGRATRELSGLPDASETREVASLNVAPDELMDAPGAHVPAWSPLVPSATPDAGPSAPDSPQGLQGAPRPAEARQVGDVLVPGFAAPLPAAEPHPPEVTAVAALSRELTGGPVSDASPASAERLTPLGAAPAAVARIGSVEVASIDEAAPQTILTGLAPHALFADGAASTTLAALSVSYNGSAADAASDISRVSSEPVRNAPASSAPRMTVVRVASISPDLILAPGAPVVPAPGALSTPADAVAFGGSPADPQESPATFDAPQVVEDGPIRLAALEPTIADWEHAALATRLVDPAPPFDLPSTPNVTVDPAAAFAEPLDALATAPSMPAPVPAAIAMLRPEPPDSLSASIAPQELGDRADEDLGRQAALKSITATGAAAPAESWVDDRPAWIRNGVAARPNPHGLPVIAIVIDEVGSYGASIEAVRGMSPMVTTSIIPSTPDAAKIARNLRLSRREVLVHMPMEANGEADLGPRPILTGMSDVQVRETALWHLTQFDGYIGVNTHRGGVATRDRRVMEALMPELEPRGLIFLDSRNAKDSVAEQAARDAGLLAAGNDFFIDDKRHTGAIYRQLDAAVAHARRHGAAIAIGNPHDVTVQAVKAWMKKNDGETVMVAPLTHVTQVLNGRRGDQIIVAGAPPKRPPPPVAISEVAEKLSSSASRSITETLSDIASDITESLFKR